MKIAATILSLAFCSGMALGGSREGAAACAALKAGLNSPDWSAASVALNRAETMGRSAVPCLVSLLREKAEFRGPCGTYSRDDSYVMYPIDESPSSSSPPEGAVSADGRRAPTIGEVALYLLLGSLQGDYAIAGACSLESQEGDLGKNTDAAAAEITELIRKRGADRVEGAEVLAVLRRHHLRFHAETTKVRPGQAS